MIVRKSAAEIEGMARAGALVAETLALVRDAVSVEAVEPLGLKGKSEAVPAFRLLAVDVTADAFVRHLDAPLVGRVREQQRLRADFEAVVSERACHLFTLLGTAGGGKARLVGEFLASGAATAGVLRGRCLPYGEDITYWPLVEILLGIGVDPGEVIGSSPADTQLAFRRLLEARAAERPQIVVLDDIQWAEGVFLDLVEHVADVVRLIEEMHRVARPGGTLLVVTPHYTDASSFADPTHRWHLNSFAFRAFYPGGIHGEDHWYSAIRLRERRLRIRLLALWRWLGLEFLVNHSRPFRRFWEFYLCYVVRGKVMEFEFEVVK